MARFLNLEGAVDGSDGDDGAANGQSLAHRVASSLHQERVNNILARKDDNCAPGHDQLPNGAGAALSEPPPCRSPVTDAFHCYPIIIAIICEIDVNTLDALSRTNRAIRAGLLQHRSILLAKVVRCINDPASRTPEERNELRERAKNWPETVRRDRWTNAEKSGRCARDMVKKCQRCRKYACRNCVMKPPTHVDLRERHRRLCAACSDAPLPQVTVSPQNSTKSPRTLENAQEEICHCDSEEMWICQPCARTMREADHDYRRIWQWRTHYGEALGGLGTGISDGDRGLVCGRERDCCAAREIEQEIDCDAEDARDTNVPSPWTVGTPAGPSNTTQTPTPPASAGSGSHNPIDMLAGEAQHNRTPSPQLGPGYARHEIVGIGGVVKRKLVRMVRVGAVVPEWWDEPGTHDMPLKGEFLGTARSLCGWCRRINPGQKDRADLKAEKEKQQAT